MFCRIEIKTVSIFDIKKSAKNIGKKEGND
jgi:hypothetical protein